MSERLEGLKKAKEEFEQELEYINNEIKAEEIDMKDIVTEALKGVKFECSCEECDCCDDEDEFIVADSTINENIGIFITEDEFGYREIELTDLSDGERVILTVEELDAIVAMARL
jgi:hypothetical protein